MIIAKHFTVRGRVQGVGYRYFAVETALRLGVRGYVRNLSGGDVEVHAEAESGVLAAFRAELERGPTMSRVSEVIENSVPVSNSYSSFHLRG
jgi:acylphosphatase